MTARKSPPAKTEGQQNNQSNGGFADANSTGRGINPRPIDPLKLTEKVMRRFFSKTLVRENGCVEWTGGKDGTGYGQFRFDGWDSKAHRVAFVAATGADIPLGLTLDHLCRNRACVSPAHLEAVPMKVNTLRGTSPTAKNASKTHCPAGHALAEGNLTATDLRVGKRRCLTCKRRRRAHDHALIAAARRHLGMTWHAYRAVHGQSAATAAAILRSAGINPDTITVSGVAA